MFGVSFLEIAVIGLVALLVVGPQKLPAMMRTAGEWIGKLRRMTSDMRAQTGIDDILREEGIDGVNELRTLLRGRFAHERSRSPASSYTPQYNAEPDLTVEFPLEGPDIAGALPDDLMINESPSPSPTDSTDEDVAVPLTASAPPLGEEGQDTTLSPLSKDSAK